MSKAKVLLPMIFWAVLVGGASFGSQSGQAREQTSSQSGQKSANSSQAGNNDTHSLGEKDQTTEYLPSDENQKSFAAIKAGTRKHLPAVSHAKPPQNRQLRSAKTLAAKDLQTEALQNVPGSHQTSPSLSSSGPGKTIRHSSLAVHPSTVALNGQQFKKARDPGARMATSGGSANSTRGTAVINGSDIRRKP
jgi:hypothetical protein